MKHLTRRSLFTLAAASGAATALPDLAWSLHSKSARTRPLSIPALAQATGSGAEKSVKLQMGRHISRFLDGFETPTFGINAPYLGPTLRFRRGEIARVDVTNKTGRASTLHWHGMHLPARQDGGPHQVIAEGKSWRAEFEIRQPAATLWYHSHMIHQTGFQVYHGLAGMIIVEDDSAGAASLPHDYGVDDVPLVLQDRRFNSDGTLDYASSMHDIMMGMAGDTLLVNGTVNPYFEARSNSLRLRILNGSNARTYQLGFADGRSFSHIAGDCGLLPAPLEVTSVVLAPAERAEIIVDLSNGEPARLVSTTPRPGGMTGGGMGMMRMMRGTGGGFDVLDIRPAQTRKKGIVLPARLVDLPAPDAARAVRTRKFSLGMGMGPGMMMGGRGMTINGRSMDMNRIDEKVRIGTQEIWQIDNPTMLAHPFHIHDVQFRILDRNGNPPAPGERGLKDTVLVHPDERVRILLAFADYADPDRPYMYHCHILEHEDAGMMGQFVVTS